jgi:hypothetical protein
MDVKRFQKLAEAINTYYAFSVLIYATVLYLSRHSHLLFWSTLALAPLLAGWTGFLFRSWWEERTQRHGFQVVSDVMTYEIRDNHKYILRYATKLKAQVNHLMVYPIGYQWTGRGKESIPEVTGNGQQLLALVKRQADKKDTVKIAASRVTANTDGDWHYWFVALNPPVHRGETVDIRYAQTFYDTAGAPKPYLYYFVRTSMQRLELNVKFPAGHLPTKVVGSYIKLSDPRRPYEAKGVQYDPQKQWATWVVEKPKKGYCYRIEWT